mmetsp:Transcript_41159/g.47385  ORF Transcript_41159/g.47385 Transcript_41159/m.47385 type:complete len:95 (-) Transcript_41159:326-610(-)
MSFTSSLSTDVKKRTSKSSRRSKIVLRIGKLKEDRVRARSLMKYLHQDKPPRYSSSNRRQGDGLVVSEKTDGTIGNNSKDSRFSISEARKEAKT